MALLAALALTACGGDSGNSTPTPATKSITIDFAAVSDTTPVTCATPLSNLGTNNASGTLADMRFYVSNVKLVRSDGSEAALTLGTNDNYNATVGADSVTLIDLEDKTGNCVGTTGTNSVITGTVPWGNYVGMKMTLGVPLSMNHTDQTASVSVTPAAINNAVHPGMAWSWAGGRKFTKVEVTNSTWTAPTFTTHLGSTGCTGANPAAGQVSACSRPNRPDLQFANFNPDTQKIALDVKALLAKNDVTVNGGGASGCMSGATDPECQAIFDALGLDLTAGAALSTSPVQRVFKAINK